MFPHWPEYLLYCFYFLVGPGMWILFAIGLYQAHKRMNLVARVKHGVGEPFPKVSILIPAKDEGENIRHAVGSALAQGYPNIDVIAIDDRSSDNTGAILDEMAVADPRLKVVHVPPGDLPAGWTGKCHALHQGVPHATGDWLLFIDAGVVLQPNALGTTLAVATKKKYGLLSLLPKMESRSVWEGMVGALAGAAVASLFTAAWTNAGQMPNTAFANGQFMLIRRDAYETAGGHLAVRDKYCEDMVMARIFKRMGLRPRVSWGTNLCSVRMYDSFAKVMRGWSRIFYASAVGKPWRSLLGIAFIFFCCYSVAPVVALGFYRNAHPISILRGWGWLATALIHYILMTVQVGIMYRWSLNPRRYALLFPIGSVFLLAIFLRSIWMCLTRRVEWRGTSYQHNLAAGRREII